MSEMFQGLTNRWLIAVSSREAAEYLVRDGLLLYNHQIVVRYYDDVLMEEYNEYEQYVAYQDQLNATRQKMINVARGNVGDYEELLQSMAKTQLHGE